jgi:hypothetical protein
MERKFFTWTEESYTEQAEVPARLQQHMRHLWLRGSSVEELAQIFKMPIEWVDDFVRRDTSETPIH